VIVPKNDTPGAAAHHPEIGRMTAAVMADRNAHEVVHHASDIAAGLVDL